MKHICHKLLQVLKNKDKQMKYILNAVFLVITLNKCYSESPPVRSPSEAVIKCKARLPRSYFKKYFKYFSINLDMILLVVCFYLLQDKDMKSETRAAAMKMEINHVCAK